MPYSTYTSAIQMTLDNITWEDENFIEELLGIAQLFRPFSVAITEFISDHGYGADPSDVEAKVAYIRAAFEKANISPPREIREWFTAGQPIKRDTAFLICFAFGLDGSETDEFFQRYYARERSFNCHQVQEAVYYFCLNNGLSYAEALDIQTRVPLAKESHQQSGDVVYTGSIIAELNDLETKEDLIAYLTENIDKFSDSNVTAYETIRRLWTLAAGNGGLLMQEREKLPSLLDDAATGEKSKLRFGNKGVKPWDAYLAILQLDKDDVKQLKAERSIRPILKKLHADAQDSFPDRQGIDKILRGEHVSYERVRKWLVLLTFYTFWAQKAVKEESYEAEPEDANRCLTSMNQHLMEAGYPELYVGNPYDWIFLFASKSEEPLYVFRFIWNELLATTLEEHL
ncbi:MAG: hypothetical protein J6A79_00570 [Clostridia bacterium]|nr:hypothetical protein [Clostridia bacterium]